MMVPVPATTKTSRCPTARDEDVTAKLVGAENVLS